MLIPFSIDQDALKCAGEDISASTATHRQVLREWRRHGSLVHSHARLNDSPLLKAIEQLPQECKKLWQTALKHNRRSPTSTAWNGLFPNDDIKGLAELSKDIKVALLDPVRSFVIGGLAPHEACKIENTLAGLELCKFHSISDSTCFSAAESLAGRDLRSNDDCNLEWRKRYTPWLNQAEHVVVVDRYIFVSHLRRIVHGEVSGLIRVFDDCFKRARDKKVSIKILCAIDQEKFPTDALIIAAIQDLGEDLAKKYSGGGIRDMALIVARDTDFAKVAHERYLRTDYSIFGIDRGIDAFGGIAASHDSVVWQKDAAINTEFSSRESYLESIARYTHKMTLS